MPLAHGQLKGWECSRCCRIWTLPRRSKDSGEKGLGEDETQRVEIIVRARDPQFGRSEHKESSWSKVLEMTSSMWWHRAKDGPTGECKVSLPMAEKIKTGFEEGFNTSVDISDTVKAAPWTARNQGLKELKEEHVKMENEKERRCRSSNNKKNIAGTNVTGKETEQETEREQRCVARTQPPPSEGSCIWGRSI